MKNLGTYKENLDIPRKQDVDKKYGVDNPPPYPVTSVNGQTGDVNIATGSGDMTKAVYDANNAVANAGGIANFVNSAQKFKFLGVNPIKSYTEDTQINWVNMGTGYAWFQQSGLLNYQPSTYGMVLSYVYGSEVFQIWNSQPSGPMYYRSANSAGWGVNWLRISNKDIATQAGQPTGQPAGSLWYQVI